MVSGNAGSIQGRFGSRTVDLFRPIGIYLALNPSSFDFYFDFLFQSSYGSVGLSGTVLGLEPFEQDRYPRSYGSVGLSRTVRTGTFRAGAVSTTGLDREVRSSKSAKRGFEF